MYCENCGCEVDPNWKFCERCGSPVNTRVYRPSTAPIPPTSQPTPAPQSVPAPSPAPAELHRIDPKAIAAFVLALVGFVVPFLNLLFGLPALLLGIFATIQSKGDADIRTKYFAIAAIIVAILDIVVGIMILWVLINSAVTNVLHSHMFSSPYQPQTYSMMS